MAACKQVSNQYGDLKDKWKVKEETQAVVCSLKLVEDISLVDVVKESGIPFPTITRIEEVIGVCLENRHKVITFPNFKPNAHELATLDRWGKTVNIEFHFTNDILTARPLGVTSA